VILEGEKKRMKKLVLGALMSAGLLQAGTGCIISGDDDDGDDVIVDDGDDISDDVGDDGTGDGILYQVTWLCPPDADEIDFTYTPFDSSTSLRTDTFDCANGDVGAEILLDPGSYDVDIVPIGDIGTFAGVVDTVEGGDGSLVTADYADFPDDAGYFFLTWAIDDEDPAIVCPKIDSAGVGVLATLVGPNDGFDDLFNCEDGVGTTDALPLGEYAIVVDLLGPSEEDQVYDSIEVDGVVLDFGDQLFDLDDFNFITL
jgi:hypothetical protein